jgi:hypothetical protein
VFVAGAKVSRSIILPFINGTKLLATVTSLARLRTVVFIQQALLFTVSAVANIFVCSHGPEEPWNVVVAKYHISQKDSPKSLLDLLCWWRDGRSA